jgi:hypothetical protein
MSYCIQIIPNGQYKLLLEREPEYCKALAMSPLKREPELEQGLWLILVFAVWSVPDRTCIDLALSVIKEFKGDVLLGVRPFDNYTEFNIWCPEVKEKYGSPIWLVLNNGNLLKEMVGVYSKEQLVQLLENVLAKN